MTTAKIEAEEARQAALNVSKNLYQMTWDLFYQLVTKHPDLDYEVALKRSLRCVFAFYGHIPKLVDAAAVDVVENGSKVLLNHSVDIEPGF